MRYLSVCSGIEAATVAWHPLGWQAVAYSEIDPFASAVLASHYPDVPNVGDMERYCEWQFSSTVDLLVGGTPCQSFSIAGLRGGLADPRGNLALTFLGIVDHFKPRFVVWENVPGILSDSTKALYSFLDGLEEVGYAIIGFDILDAQWFELAQRRRRVFVCAQSIEDLISRRTVFSGIIAVQCLAEIWQSALAVLCGQLNRGAASWASPSSECERSLKKRIALFGLQKEEQALRLLNCLDVLLPSSGCEPSASDSDRGRRSVQTPQNTKGTKSQKSDERAANTDESQSIAPSWKSTLAEGLKIASECITSTASSETIESRIFICAQDQLTISKFMPRLNPSLPNFSVAAASCLTALKGYMNYARLTSSDLFGEMGRLRGWIDFLGQAESTSKSIECIGVRNFGQVLPLRESLLWDSAPRREARQSAPTIPSRCTAGGGLGTDFDLDGGPIAFHATQDTISGPLSPCIGQGNSKNGQASVAIAFSSKDHGADAGETSPTLRACGHVGSHANGGAPPAVLAHDTANIRAASGGSSRSYIAQMRVRRLTPRECERLQGFPDDYTAIKYRGKAAADGPRYKALGNSMAVPVMRWIGERIAAVDGLEGSDHA